MTLNSSWGRSSRSPILPFMVKTHCPPVGDERGFVPYFLSHGSLQVPHTSPYKLTAEVAWVIRVCGDGSSNP